VAGQLAFLKTLLNFLVSPIQKFTDSIFDFVVKSKLQFETYWTGRKNTHRILIAILVTIPLLLTWRSNSAQKEF